MKNMRLKSGIVCAVGLFACGASIAQPGGMSMPTLPQAIGTHMEQKRTLEQREAMEAKAAAHAPSQEPAAPKKPAAKKPKKTRSQTPT